ncbi:MFS transporter [Leifsonia sp. AG29]|uniref:MFS transporter n=1 Tax=Leifsonia sp. AG29 TaxID=2598860 RepID=UPI00131E2FD7|nr:MFS transporter [Leifsonia sp. AG29]
MVTPTRSTRWLALATVLLATFMAQFDLYVVNVALPVLQRQLHAEHSALQLIVGGYAFVYAAGLITAGRLGDRFGHRTVFLIGMAAFGLASLWCGLAQTGSGLVEARLVQGLAASVMVPQVLALISRLFTPAGRPRALSAFGVVIGIGAVAGQVVGGLLLHADLFGLHWRPIFLVNVPIALIGVVAGALLLPRHETTTHPRFDVLGAISLPVGLALLLVPLTLGQDAGWPWWTSVAIVAGALVVAAVLMWERRLSIRGGEPVLDPRLFRQAAFANGMGLSAVIFASFFSFVFTLSLLFQDGIGLSPLDAGLAFAPLSIAFAVASILARGFIARYGARVIVLGTALACLGLLAIVIILAADRHPTTPLLIVPMVIVGLGNGTAVPVLTGVVLQGVKSGAGMVSGILTTAQQFATAAGIAILGAVFFTALGTSRDLGGYTGAMLFSTTGSLILAGLAVLISVRLVNAAKPGSPAPHITGSTAARR